MLLLKVLVEGKANLYSYVEGNLFRYFYSLDNNKIEQLVFKSYIIDEKYGENNKYKQQFLNELKCDGITLNQVERLEYKKNSLTNFFKKFNSCTNSDYKTLFLLYLFWML